MLDPTLLGALTATIEKTANLALAYDPGTRAGLGRMSGKILALESTFPELTLYLSPQPETSNVSLTVQSHCALPVDVRLKGSLLAVLALALGPQHSLANSGVEVSGSTGLLSEFQDVIGDLDIDWEEAVNELLGTTLGHQLAQLLRGQAQWINTSVSKAEGFIGDYLTEELRTTPAKVELEHFYDEVNDLRSRTDRLNARLQQLDSSSPGPVSINHSPAGSTAASKRD